jgi:hypothetical protein
MPVFTPKSLQLSVDGKSIDLNASEAAAHKINVALSNPATFKTFSADPKSFLAGHGVTIGDDVAGHIHTRLAGVASLEVLRNIRGDGPVSATAWAVAQGAYSIASTKIAIAF